MEEHEEYSVYANIPYLLHEGHSVEDVEKEILDYGLTGKIDQELTDDLSTTIVKDDKVIHSVRGTDFTSGKDIVSDAGIVASHPAVIKLINTYFASSFDFDNFKIPIEEDSLNQITKLTPEFYKKQLYTLTDWGEYMTAVGEDPDFAMPEWNYQEWFEEIKSVEKKLKKAKEAQIQEKEEQSLDILFEKGMASFISYYVTNYLKNQRINPEIEKLIKIKQKYPNKEIELTGHSLGSLVNVLGRKEGIKTITFNPAPQYEKGEPHPESKIYRTSGDPVSFFLSAEDKEPVTELKPKLLENRYKPFLFNVEDNILYQIHSLKQFLPKKKVGKPLPQEILPTSREEKPDESYCRKFPNDPDCQKGTLEDI